MLYKITTLDDIVKLGKSTTYVLTVNGAGN